MGEMKLIGTGATAKVYLEEGRAVKVYENLPLDEVEREAWFQQFAHKSGLPVPEVFGVEVREGKTALMMQHIAGLPLMRPKMDRDERLEALSTLVTLQQQVHAISALRMPDQIQKLTWKIEHAPDLEEIEREKLLALLNQLDRGKHQLCHGDFHPMNILCDETQNWIIDWVDTTSGDPLADACRSYILFYCHISRMAGMYLRSYCTAAGATERDVLSWLPVIAAARLSEHLDKPEREKLLNLVRTELS